MFSGLSKQELREKARKFACGLAAADYELDHPGCTKEEAWAHAVNHWEPLVGQALRFMAMCDVLEGLKNAIPWN